MAAKKIISIALILVLGAASLPADLVIYAEQYYKLYHQHLYQYPDDSLEIIHYLELALSSDFANPLYAIAVIHDKTEYKRYMDLFRMHVNLKIIEQYLHIGSKFDKFEVYFYNKEGPWKEAICDSLKTAQWAYTTALYYWKQAQAWSTEAFKLRNVHLPDIQLWEDECFRIQTADLDYERTIQKQLSRLGETRAYLGCTP